MYITVNLNETDLKQAVAHYVMSHYDLTGIVEADVSIQLSKDHMLGYNSFNARVEGDFPETGLLRKKEDT